jgi:hypothetical protein
MCQKILGRPGRRFDTAPNLMSFFPGVMVEGDEKQSKFADLSAALAIIAPLWRRNNPSFERERHTR